MNISILCSDPEHPVVKPLRAWVDSISSRGHHAVLLFDKADLQGGDILFLVSCAQIIQDADRRKYRATLVLHASDLPRGRGWSPHIWSVLAGASEITVSLLEASDPVDSGDLWLQTRFALEGHELLPEINDKLFAAELWLMEQAVMQFGTVVPSRQTGDPGPYMEKRSPADSRLDPDKTIAAQFDLLRVVDSQRYPAFFDFRGKRYSVRIEKIEKVEMGNSTKIDVAGRTIGPGHRPFVIAEMSGNHNQSLDRALKIVEAAANAGAHGLKIQTYTPETMTLDIDQGEFFIHDADSLWTGTSLYKLYGEAHTPWDWHEPIFRRARDLGMVPFSTPFDDTAVDLLESLDVACYKIASFENTDLPLIRRVAATGKPLIVSTGMASIAELDETVQAARQAGCKDLVLLKCTSTYPATADNTNILTIPHLRQLFGCEVGLSDHTMGVGVSVASVALGASVIEKHFTLSRADGGVDSTFSMEPAEMAQLVVETERAWQALGQISYGPTAAERKSIQFRRSLYITKDLLPGDRLTPENLRAIRPGHGLPTKYLDIFLGRTVRVAVKRGTPLTWGLL